MSQIKENKFSQLSQEYLLKLVISQEKMIFQQEGMISSQEITIATLQHELKCPCCSKENEKETIVSSKKEPSLIPKSFACSTLLAYIAAAKYQDSLPLYRLEKIFSRYGP